VLPAVLGAALVARLRPAAGSVAFDLVVGSGDDRRRTGHHTAGHGCDVRAGPVDDRDNVRRVALQPGQQRHHVGRGGEAGPIEARATGYRLGEPDRPAGGEDRQLGGKHRQPGQVAADRVDGGLVGALFGEVLAQRPPPQVEVQRADQLPHSPDVQPGMRVITFPPQIVSGAHARDASSVCPAAPAGQGRRPRLHGWGLPVRVFRP
jgi:hypothetical protein